MNNYIKRNLKLFIMGLSVVVVIICYLALFYNVPRLSYSFSKEYNGYIVSNAYGNTDKYIVPSDYNGKAVVGIGERAFFRHDKLKEVVFTTPENIEYIGKLAFSECYNLKSIDISFVNEISRNAFSYDSSLESVTLSARRLGASVFYKCESLKNVNLKEGIDTIGSMCFSHTAIERINIPNSISKIYNDCFLYAKDLKEIIISSEKINDSIFTGSNEYLMTLSDIIVAK